MQNVAGVGFVVHKEEGYPAIVGRWKIHKISNSAEHAISLLWPIRLLKESYTGPLSTWGDSKTVIRAVT